MRAVVRNIICWQDFVTISEQERLDVEQKVLVCFWAAVQGDTHHRAQLGAPALERHNLLGDKLGSIVYPGFVSEEFAWKSVYITVACSFSEA